MKLQNWIVIQEENGYGNAVFDYSIEHNWLFEPVIPAEIKCSEEFTGIEAYIIDECTGQRVNCDISVETKNKRDYKITVEGLPVGPLFSVVKKLCFTEKNGNKYQFSPEIIARHISVGEVYIIAGQSNAEGTAVMNIYEEPKIGVNALSKDGIWDIASHPIGGYGHSPFITFGKAIQRKLNCSVGLIPRAVGGSQISEWIKGGTHFEKLKKEIESEDIKASAVIWYQGCSDTDSCEQTQAYEKNFIEFTCEIRNALRNEKLPIYTFQLNRLYEDGESSEVTEKNYSEIREIQRKMPQKLENVYVIPTVDCRIMSDKIHNGTASNLLLGERLALLMLDKTYGKEKSFYAPDIEAATVTSENELTLTFKNVQSYLDAKEVSADKLPIRLSDEYGIVKAESYKIEKNKIKITYERKIGSNPLVSGMYGKNPLYCILDYQTQLPILCFTDFKAEKSNISTK